MKTFSESLTSSCFPRTAGRKSNLVSGLENLLWDESGPTAVEYAVMLALIIGVCIGAIGLFGSTASGSWTDTSGKLGTAMGS